MQREAEYKRLNDELEAKTTSLFQETETMLRQQEEYLAAAEKLESQGPDYYVDPHLDGDVDGAATDFGFSNALGSQCLRKLKLSLQRLEFFKYQYYSLSVKVLR